VFDNWDLAEMDFKASGVIGDLRQCFAKETGLLKSTTPVSEARKSLRICFVQGWQAAHKRVPATFLKSVEGCEDRLQHYLVTCKAGENKEWGPKDWFCAGYWRFQSWAIERVNSSFVSKEAEGK
jgi:hypothetical protein